MLYENKIVYTRGSQLCKLHGQKKYRNTYAKTN